MRVNILENPLREPNRAERQWCDYVLGTDQDKSLLTCQGLKTQARNIEDMISS